MTTISPTTSQSPNVVRLNPPNLSERVFQKCAGARHLARVLFAALPKILKAISFGLVTSPKRSLQLFETVLDDCDRNANDPILGTCNLDNLLQSPRKEVEVQIVGKYLDRRSSDTRQLKELVTLATLVQCIDAKVIFEFGTFVGRTTRLLSLNAPSAKVITLDLPQGIVSHAIGEFYRNTPEALRIEQLASDSRSFDSSPYANLVDFCWVDACHERQFVLSDTRSALRMVHANGFLAWHDYRHTAQWSGVTQVVQELNKFLGGGIKHIEGTSIAILHLTPEAKEQALHF